MTILVAGDYCPQNRVASYINDGNFEYVFSGVKDIISRSDYSIVNFECPVSTGNEKPIVKQGPNLRCSKRSVEALKWLGFKCVTLANNHFYDYGEAGVINTLEACREYKLDTVGGGNNLHSAKETLYKQIDGYTLAIINCCEHEFSIATKSKGGSNPLNSVQQYYKIKESRERADFVLVIVHGGHEHYQLPSPRMKETYRFFIDAGADAVVNHHQHCFSGFEWYQGKPILYGIGNFCFEDSSKKNTIWNEGFMVDFRFDKSITFRLIPYLQCNGDSRLTILKEYEFDHRIKELNSIISQPDLLEKTLDKYYQSCSDIYSSIIEPCNNRYYLACRRRGWLPSFITLKRKIKAANFIHCESHRDKLSYYLENL